MTPRVDTVEAVTKIAESFDNCDCDMGPRMTTACSRCRLAAQLLRAYADRLKQETPAATPTLQMCACEQFYESHPPDCPVAQQLASLTSENERLKVSIEDWKTIANANGGNGLKLANRCAAAEAELASLTARWETLKDELYVFAVQPDSTNLYRQAAKAMSRTVQDIVARLEQSQ